MKISAPGKLFISGEWAILEPENFGIVAAIDKRIFVEINDSPNENIYVSLKDFGLNNLKAEPKARRKMKTKSSSAANFSNGELKFSKKLTKKEKKILAFSKSAIETALRYLGNYKPFRIEVRGDEGFSSSSPSLRSAGEEKRKIGFGFSAASTAAIIAAVLAFQKKKPKREEVFKLSALSHYLAQGKIGSGFDIAASVFGGIFVYRRFDAAWLKTILEKEKNIKKIIEKPWPNFYFKKLNWPKNIQLSVGWTGKSALTPQLIKKLRKWREKNQSEYKRLIFGIGNLVKELTSAWKSNNKEKILELIKKNEDYLRELGEKSGVNIETKKLKKMSEIADKFGGAGKLSGAGAGDCGIAITFDKKFAQKIEEEWKKNYILPIKKRIDFSGVKIEN